MTIKKILFVTACTLGLTVSTANAQEQEKAQEQAQETVAEAAPMAAQPAGVEGMWVRKEKQDVKVEIRNGGLYCTLINRKKKNGKPKKDYEMCHGMTKQGDAWKGKHMKHPDMPGFMTFKGTVTVDGDVLKIKGCAGICDSEKWNRAKPAG